MSVIVETQCSGERTIDFFQALPLMTLVVGHKTDTGLCRVFTTSSVDGPNYVEFVINSSQEPLAPSKPAWANYVKGVVACYQGKLVRVTNVFKQFSELIL